MKVLFNGIELACLSTEGLDPTLDRVDLEPQFELWISCHDGPSLAMLRNGDHAWLMCLRFDGDSGLVSQGDQHQQGVCSYTLSNGQIDEYPRSWCLSLEACYQAIAHFFAHDGARDARVTWQEV